MKHLFFILAFWACFLGSLFAADGFRIDVKLDNYDMPQLQLAKYLGGSFKYLDTVQINPEGRFVFEGDQALAAGIYTIVLLPKKNAVQVLLDTDNQNLQLHLDAQQIKAEKIKFVNNDLNTNFYNYLIELSKRRRELNTYYKKIPNSPPKLLKKLYKQIDKCQKGIRDFQLKTIKKYPNSLIELAAQTDLEAPFPKFKDKDIETINQKRFSFRHNHFFDELKFEDPRHSFNPRYFNKINFFTTKMTPQIPDSVANSIFSILNRIQNNPALFQHTLDFFVKKYEKPTIVGMDAVYVQVVDRYHAKDETPWLKEAQLRKILKTANTYRRILIGQTAPDIKVYRENKQPVSLHDIQAKLTVLFFWRPGCGFCKKASPKLKAFYEKYKEQDIEILSLCTSLGEKTKECWEYVEKNELDQWINAVDPRHQSRFIKIYNAHRTPKFYILDQNKQILTKDFGVDQLEKLINRFLESAKESDQ